MDIQTWTHNTPQYCGYYWLMDDSLSERVVVRIGALDDEAVSSVLENSIYVQDGDEYSCIGSLQEFMSNPEYSNVRWRFIEPLKDPHE